MSYGKWKALHYVPPVVVVIPQQEVQEPEIKKPAVKRLCLTCGKEIRGHKNRQYCDYNCKYEADKVRQRAYYHRNKERMMENGKI